MFSWIYQALLAFVARVLSWFGLSFSAQEVSDTLEVAQKVAGGSNPQLNDAPLTPEESQGPQPFSVEAPQAPPSLLP